MNDNFAPRLARIITEYSIPINPGEFVVIGGNVEATPMLLALYEAVLKRGGHPHLDVILPETQELFYRNAQDHHLDFVDPIMMATVEKVDVYIRVSAESNPKSLNNVPPQLSARRQKAMRPAMEIRFKRAFEGKMRWNVVGFPSRGAAQEAEMGFYEYSDFVYKACGLHHDDPVAYWQSFRDKQTRLVEWLNGKKWVEVRGPGIDLSLSIEGRTWISAHGDVNFPDGEIFTGPVEESVNGTVAFSYPTNYGGRQVSGARLTFRDGVVVEASASKNEAYLISQLDTDEGARRVGEFAIGTNNDIQQFTGSTLFDEKIGGTMHMALGRSYPETGGVNSSAIHWDMVHGMRDGGEIYVDGVLFYRNGEFVI